MRIANQESMRKEVGKNEERNSKNEGRMRKGQNERGMSDE